jgi:16S rRNA (guanine966-N2)-methyltransferase
MRIIAGEHRGRRLIPPEGATTRPITDRAKQSLFDILTPDLPGSIVYDLFCGTGSLGLEALSRGSEKCLFFESDRSALARLNQNIMELGVAARSRIVSGDLFKWFELASVRPQSAQAPGADVVFLDPPYRFLHTHRDEILQLCLHLTRSHLRPKSVVVFRHDGSDSLPLPRLEAFDVRQYGDMTIEMLRQAGPEEP